MLKNFNVPHNVMIKTVQTDINLLRISYRIKINIITANCHLSLIIIICSYFINQHIEILFGAFYKLLWDLYIKFQIIDLLV